MEEIDRTSTPRPMSALPALRTLHDGPEARMALHPLRRELLARLAEPASAAQAARDLGLARQKVNYHLRLLEEAGLVELVETRTVGNCTERVLRSRARAFVVAPGALGDLAPDPDTIRDRFSAAYLTAVAARAVQEVSELGSAAEAADKKLATLCLETEVRFASPAAQHAFAQDLANAVREIAARHHDDHAPQGRRFRFFVGGYPARTDPLGDAS